MKYTLQELEKFTDEELEYHLLTPDGKGKDKKKQMLDELVWRKATDKEIELKKN